MNRIAEFEKVSFEKFKDSMENVGIFLDDEEYLDIYNNIKLPERSTTGSAGYDFFSPFTFTLKGHKNITIPTGIRCKMENGWVLALFPRSGLGFKHRMQLDNTVAIIDSDYYYSDNEGHIMVKFTNDSLDLHEFDVEVGKGIVQGIFLPFGITVDDSVTAKRNGGFGSTDNK